MEIQKQLHEQILEPCEEEDDQTDQFGDYQAKQSKSKSLSKYQNIKSKVQTFHDDHQQGNFQHQGLIDQVLEKEEHSYFKKSSPNSPKKMKNKLSDLALKNKRSVDDIESYGDQSNASSNETQSLHGLTLSKHKSHDQSRSRFLPHLSQNRSQNQSKLNLNFSQDVIMEADDEIANTIKNQSSLKTRFLLTEMKPVSFSEIRRPPQIFTGSNLRIPPKVRFSKTEIIPISPRTLKRKSLKETMRKIKSKKRENENLEETESQCEDKELYRFWHSQANAMDEELTEKAKKIKEAETYQKVLLMRKGLNREFVEEFKLMKLTQEFERRSQNPRHKMNKDQVMKQLMATFTNNTYLVQLKQKSKELEKQLLSIGINYDSYKSLASQLNRNYPFTKERKTLVQRVQESNDENVLKLDTDKEQERQKHRIDSELQNQLTSKLKQIMKGNQSIRNKDTVTNQNPQKAQQVNSPDFSKSVIIEQNGDISIANDKQFDKLINLMNEWYEAEEPVDQPYLRQFSKQSKTSLTTPNSPFLSPSPSSSVSASQRKKHPLNPKYILSNHATQKHSQSASNNQFSMVHYSNGIHDKEMNEFSKYCNLLLLKSSDNFIKAKLKALQKKQSQDDSKPNFFQRMQEDQKKREQQLKIKEEAKQAEEKRKLKRLKRLSYVTHKAHEGPLSDPSQQSPSSHHKSQGQILSMFDSSKQPQNGVHTIKRSTTFMKKEVPKIKLEQLEEFKMEDNLSLIKQRFLEQRKQRLEDTLRTDSTNFETKRRSVKFDLEVKRFDEFLKETKHSINDPVEVKIQQIENEIRKKKHLFRY